MDIKLNGTTGSRTVYRAAQTAAVQSGRRTAARTPRGCDSVDISAAARTSMAKGTAGVSAENRAALPAVNVPSFSGAFSFLADGYDQALRGYYAEAHAENMRFDDPAHHIWEKYKDSESACFRSDMSELERAWAYDQEMDLALRDGKNMNMTDPYAFQGTAPSLESTAVQANQMVRDQLDREVGELFRQAGVPDNAVLRLSVDAGSQRITVSGLDDAELTAQLEDVLNQGDNGKNLYEHIRLCDPAQFGGRAQEQYVPGSQLNLIYRSGHLMDVDNTFGYGPGQTDWQSNLKPEDCDMDAFKQAVSPNWTRLWGGYNPQQGPMDNWSFMHSQGVNHGPEWEARMEAGIRATMPALVEQVRTDKRFSMQDQMSQLMQRAAGTQGNGSAEKPETARLSETGKRLDPETRYRVGIRAYMDSMVAQWQEEEETIKRYYAAGIAENNRFSDPIAHIARKYCAAFALSNPLYFRGDLSLTARKLAARQEYAIMMGGTIKHNDPYALAASGGQKTNQEASAIARQYAESVVAAMEYGNSI